MAERESCLSLVTQLDSKEPLMLENGETSNFIEYGDLLTLCGHAEDDGYRVDFGARTGTLLPARG